MISGSRTPVSLPRRQVARRRSSRGRVHAHRLGRLTERSVHEHFLRNSLSVLVMRAPIGTAHPVADTHTPQHTCFVVQDDCHKTNGVGPCGRMQACHVARRDPTRRSHLHHFARQRRSFCRAWLPHSCRQGHEQIANCEPFLLQKLTREEARDALLHAACLFQE